MLNEASIRAAKSGTLWDGSLKGFGLRVGKTRKTFIVLVASGRRKAIGTWPLVNLATARAEAKRLLAEKTLGKIRPTHSAFDDAKTDYLAYCTERVKAGTMKPRTLKDYTRLLKLFPFGRQSVADIAARDIIQRLKPTASFGKTPRVHCSQALLPLLGPEPHHRSFSDGEHGPAACGNFERARSDRR